MSLPLPRIYSPTSPGASVSSLLYLYDSTGVSVDPYTNVARSTGIFRAVEPFDLGTSVGTVNVSGIDTLIVDTDQLESIGTSGSQYLASISGDTRFLRTGTHLVSLTGSNNTAFASTVVPSVSGSMSAATTGIALQANATRKKLYTQVVGSGGALFVGYGSAPSAQSFSLALKSATADIGTDGGIVSDSDFKGAVYVSGTQAVRFIIWEGV